MQRALAALHPELPHERDGPRIGVGEKLADIFLLKAHFGPSKNASNHSQYAKCPDCPNGDIKSGKSNKVNKARDKERNKKQSPALRPLVGLYRIAAIRAHRNATNYAAFRQRKLIPLRPFICSTSAQICRCPDVFTAPGTIQFRPHVIQHHNERRAPLFLLTVRLAIKTTAMMQHTIRHPETTSAMK